MFKKFLHFIKYNNAVVFIIMAVFLLASGVFAQTETGQEFVGEKQTSVVGEDNTLLLELDVDTFDMDFKIEKIEEDEKYYYVTYTFLDIVKDRNIWQYEMSENVRKISKRIEKDLGVFIAEELGEQYVARKKDLISEQIKNTEVGETTRLEQTEYSGLIGQTLNLIEKVFPDYEAVKTVSLPSPQAPALASIRASDEVAVESSGPDNLTEIFNEYMEKIDTDSDKIFNDDDNCPYISNPLQVDTDKNGIGDACEVLDDIEDPVLEEDEEIIEEESFEEEPIVEEQVTESPVADDAQKEEDEETVEEAEVTIEEEIIIVEPSEEVVEIIELN